MIRIDKYLSNLWLVSRRNISKYVKAMLIMVNWDIVKKSDMKIKEGDIINFDWKDIEVKNNIYIILNKPKWYICSNIDEDWYFSYRKLLVECPYVNMLNVAGRLDQDTEWLTLLTNDGLWIHNIISPKLKMDKEYHVELENIITDEDIEMLEKWVELDDGYITMPSRVEKLKENIIKLIIHEWKYHQVKRMMESIWNRVIYLRRDKIWDRDISWMSLWEWKYIIV